MFISWIAMQVNYDGENIGENVEELAPPGVYWHSYMMKSFGTGEQASI